MDYNGKHELDCPKCSGSAVLYEFFVLCENCIFMCVLMDINTHLKKKEHDRVP